MVQCTLCRRFYDCDAVEGYGCATLQQSDKTLGKVTKKQKKKIF